MVSQISVSVTQTSSVWSSWRFQLKCAFNVRNQLEMNLNAACLFLAAGFYQPEKGRKNQWAHHLHGGAEYDMFTVKILQHHQAGIDNNDNIHRWNCAGNGSQLSLSTDMETIIAHEEWGMVTSSILTKCFAWKGLQRLSQLDVTKSNEMCSKRWGGGCSVER